MITTLTGANSFMLQAELNSRVEKFLRSYGDMGLERVDGEEAEFNRIQEALTSMPFLATRKLVVLRNPSAQKVFTEKITEVIGDIPEAVDVIIYESKLDKRSSYYKTLKAKTEFMECGELDNFGLARWLVTAAKNQKGELKQADAQFLVERVGANQQLLNQELNKLLAYDPIITHESILLLTDPTPQSTIFELLDAAFAGKAEQAFAIYEEQRKLKVEPQQILAMLIWQLHVLTLIKTAEGRSIDEIAAAAKMSPYVLRKSQTVAQKLTYAELKSLLVKVLDIDVALKSQSIDADEALKNLILSLSV